MLEIDGPALLRLHAQASAPPLLLDVRDAWELAIAQIRIDGLETLRVPMHEVPERFGEIDRSRPVVCICHHGVRSVHVARFLERQGFEVVYNLTGGIDAWSDRVDRNVARY